MIQSRIKHVTGRTSEHGVSMIELLVAIMVLMVGVLAVARLVPAALNTNLRSRYDTTALVLSERLMSYATSQELKVGNPPPGRHYFVNGVDPDGVTLRVYLLGARSPQALAPVGSAPTPRFTDAGSGLQAGRSDIDWGTGAVAGYSVSYQSPDGYIYETRWAVRTFFENFNGNIRPVAKRIIVSTRGGPDDPNRNINEVTLVTMQGWN